LGSLKPVGAEPPPIPSNAAHLTPWTKSNFLAADLVVVGSLDGEKVFLYQWNGTDWIETIVAPSGEGERYWGFGQSLEISENLLAVAALTYNEGGVSGAGGVFLFHQEEGEWVESIITASDGHREDSFGWDLSISGDTMAVGAPHISAGPGAVYLYRWNGAAWEETILKAEGPWNNGNRFGGSVSLDANRLAVGATGTRHLHSGSVYLYDWDGTDWIETILKPSDSAVGDGFGTSVTLVGDLLTVSSRTMVYQFVWNGESWTEKKWLEGPPEDATSYLLTQALSPDAGLLVIGESIFPGPSICTVFNLRAEAGPLPADLLLERYFPAEEIAANRYGLLADDPDGDGQNTLIELSTGTHPLEKDSVQAPMEWSSIEGRFEFDFYRHPDGAFLNSVFMCSSNLQDWIPCVEQPTLTSTDPLTGLERWHLSRVVSTDAASAYFKWVVFE
jgi:hypothetical protein